MTTGRIVTYTTAGRPALLNAERSAHWRDHRGTTRANRTEAGLRLLAEGRKGVMPMVKIDVWSLYDNRLLPDTGACLPTVKAIIDGAVDAGLLPHDGPAVVKHLAFWSPTTDKETGNQLLVSFQELEEGSPWLL